MQNSSEFQYVAVDTIHESATKPRRTFDEFKLGGIGREHPQKRPHQAHHRSSQLGGIRDRRGSEALPCRTAC